MSENKVKEYLQQINFIETDMDLHKQILFSIPPDQKEEIEKVVLTIAGQKKQIQALRMKIKETDGDEYNKILALEQATERFKELSRDKKFARVLTLNDTGECFITLNDDTRIDCLVAAEDESGNWTVLNLEGEIGEYPGGLVKT